MKAILERGPSPSVIRPSSSTLPGTASDNPSPFPSLSVVPGNCEDQIPLMPGSSVCVSARQLKCLKSLNPSVYIGDLAVLVFGRETMATSSLTGRQSGAHKDLESKPTLDPEKVDSLIGVYDAFIKL
ncbi:hypothetical protein DPEC_G00071980 [Dallia pectoralis]|uniref:Uncharacterized protein n=1 Tax=Dallia pectoralis TaxID=75939 RepID=A0ACC2H2E0_DALPE|nr:hypothetical protein DPEC_G00071980 [Dallia pectoralis]